MNHRVNYHAHIFSILSSPGPPILFKIHFNIILSSTPRSSKWYISCIFPNQKPVCISLFPHIYLGLFAHIISVGQYMFNPSVPCRRFAACKRSLELRGSRILGEICRNIFLAHEEFHLPLLEVSRVVGREGT